MDEKEYLQGRLLDLSERAGRNEYMTHSAFLDPSGAALFARLLKSQGAGTPEDGVLEGTRCLLYGGYPDAERKAAVFLPSYLDAETFLEEEEKDPALIACLEIRPLQEKFADALTHRDYLGALMHLGIERDQVGDILTGPSSACVFVMKDMAGFIISELTRVKHTVVRVREIPPADCGISPALKEKTGSVASVRLDSVMAMAFQLSRSLSGSLIRGEKAAVDGQLVTDPDYRLLPGQRVSLRGYGKIIYEGEVHRTKKDRHMVRVLIFQ